MLNITTKGTDELVKRIEEINRFAKIRTGINAIEQRLAKLEKLKAQEQKPETEKLLWPSISNRKD